MFLISHYFINTSFFFGYFYLGLFDFLDFFFFFLSLLSTLLDVIVREFVFVVLVVWLDESVVAVVSVVMSRVIVFLSQSVFLPFLLFWNVFSALRNASASDSSSSNGLSGL